MTILGLKRSLFGTPTRRLAALLGSNAAFYGGGYLIQRYIDESASSPGFSFVLVFLWMALGVTAALFTLIALGDRLLHRGFSDRFLRDDLEGLDKRLALAERGLDPSLVTIDEDEAPMSYSPFRFGLLFLALTAINLVSANRLGGGFLQRYTHPGVAIVHLRSSDPVVRRNGLTMLTERLQIVATPAVARAVLAMLDDPDEGVKARAAFVIGTLGIEAGADPLARLAVQNEALTFAALIALGQIRQEGARKAIMGIVDEPAILQEPRALAMALGLRAPAIERLQAIFRQAQGGSPDPRGGDLGTGGGFRPPARLRGAGPRGQELVVRCAAAGRWS
ncbi:MAG: HEAT repeat domain-containing protein [bacterium]